jgi:hypothetical protein
MKFSQLSKKTKLTIIVYSILGLMVGVFAVGVYLNGENSKELFEKGVRSEATVTDVYYYSSDSKRNKNYRYYMDVMFFTNIEKVKVQPKSDNIVDKVAAISEEAIANAKLGSLKSTRIEISRMSYEKYRKGDKVTVVYLEGEESDARLLNEVQ